METLKLHCFSSRCKFGNDPFVPTLIFVEDLQLDPTLDGERMVPSKYLNERISQNKKWNPYEREVRRKQRRSARNPRQLNL